MSSNSNNTYPSFKINSCLSAKLTIKSSNLKPLRGWQVGCEVRGRVRGLKFKPHGAQI